LHDGVRFLAARAETSEMSFASSADASVSPANAGYTLPSNLNVIGLARSIRPPISRRLR
jgi:hypothetical protein